MGTPTAWKAEGEVVAVGLAQRIEGRRKLGILSLLLCLCLWWAV